MNTCNEKAVVAKRVGLEIPNLQPSPPAMRIFDAGIGDGTVLSHVLRDLHCHYPTMPFYAAAKEVSLEDVRLTLQKMPDRYFQYPAMVMIITNMNYSEAPWFTPKTTAAAGALKWHEVALTGSTSHEFEVQIEALADPTYLQATKNVLEKYNSLWFNNESHVISRNRG